VRLISILLVLVFIAFLVMKQLDSGPSKNNVEEISNNENVNTPKVPTSPKGIQEFEKDMNKLILDQTEKRNENIEKSLGN